MDIHCTKYLLVIPSCPCTVLRGRMCGDRYHRQSLACWRELEMELELPRGTIFCHGVYVESSWNLSSPF
jgi:hypothetical protein